MGSGMPEIGSRISLISKADIRYEGKLFAVDPEECTIALSSVRSYGTEDRDTTYPVPAQSQVYDYILFRGSDIKDIRVLTTTIPNDPAIVQLSVPPSITDSQFQTRISYPQPPIASMAMPNAPSTSRQSQTFQNSGFTGTSTSTNVPQPAPKPQTVQNVLSEDESRSSTPTAQNVTTKNTETVFRTSTGSSKSDEHNTQRRQPSFGGRDNKMQGNRPHAVPKQQYQQQRYQQNRYPQQQGYLRQQYRDYNRENYNRDNQYRNYNDYRDSYGPRQYTQPLRNVQRNNDNWSSYGPRRNNNRGGQTGGQNYQQMGYQNQNRKPRNTLKFDADYDFEQANTEFEEMRSKLAKVKIDESFKVNGDVENKKEDSGNEVSGEENETEGEEKPIFYDKVKSFFDQISYEAIERSKGLTQRMDWKTERKINSETFGSVALRRNPNFRGRPNSGYYSNYQNRNPNMSNNYRTGGYNRQQGNQRRQYNPVNRNQDESKENQVA